MFVKSKQNFYEIVIWSLNQYNPRIQVYKSCKNKITILRREISEYVSRGPTTADISLLSINLIVDNVDTSVTVYECNKHVYIKQFKNIIKNKKCVVLFICSI